MAGEFPLVFVTPEKVMGADTQHAQAARLSTYRVPLCRAVPFRAAAWELMCACIIGREGKIGCVARPPRCYARGTCSRQARYR